MRKFTVRIPLIVWKEGAEPNFETQIWEREWEVTDAHELCLVLLTAEKPDGTYQYPFTLDHIDGDIALFLPFTTHWKESMASDMPNFGYTLARTLHPPSAPVDDPFCGYCGNPCMIAWSYEDIAGDGPSIIGAEGESECCQAQLFSDPGLTVEWNPDPNEYGAFEE